MLNNILVEKPPDVLTIEWVECRINSGFRDCLRTILAFEDPELTNGEKQAIMLTNMFIDKPPDIVKAFEAGIEFLNGGMGDEGDGREVALRLYSFSQDARFIFAAFRQTHGIDLDTADMHWWKFLTLFMDLGADTTFSNLVGLRKRIKTGKASKEEKAMYNEMRDIVDLPEPDNRTPEEKERETEFMKMVAEGKKRRAEQKAQKENG